ncbi:cytochrome c [Bradyrhizobium sp. LHD-71]|uniref:c-type cytochrome n=1 Tax=Bradyrhizobium sp. LHD-71 TaxID=3072141 RepID=UPI002810071C|nr:cytochrome c [Bradyrhizobium sp. LHD-71]MDQ8729171.1 cytochrome c [Bradyrhizobium sp. LHD-71]
MTTAFSFSRIAVIVCAFAFVLALPVEAVAQTVPVPMLSTTVRFAAKSGADLYASVCQGCHMQDGKGAVGAGSYPSLADNKNLEAGGYPVTVVVNGLRGMPPLGVMMSDEQVAEVVNYVRTNFGNAYNDAVTAEDAKGVRP